MKIGLISDLHTDATEVNKAIIPFLINAIKKAELDVLIVAGDITAKLSEFYEVLAAFNTTQITCLKLFVPGNHDIWVSKDMDMTSTQKCGVLSEICEDHGFYFLMDEPYINQDIGFCGTIGWYDYSFAPKEYSFSNDQYAKKQLMGKVWSDKRYAKWDNTDIVVSKRFENLLSDHLSFLNDKVKRIIIVSHHVPFRQCIRYRGTLPWDYFQAFMGSEALGDICLQESLVTHVLFGHTHSPVNQQIENLRAICAPIGYLNEYPQDGLQAYCDRILTCFCLDNG